MAMTFKCCDLALAAMFSIFIVSRAGAIVPVIQAVNLSPQSHSVK